EQLPNVGERPRRATDVGGPLAEKLFVYVTERGYLDIRDSGKGVDVVFSPASKAADRDADSVAGAEDSRRRGNDREAAERADAGSRGGRALQKVASSHTYFS